MLPAILRRFPSRRFLLAGAVVLVALTASLTWLRFHGADIDLDINTATARRPLVVQNGKVTQMPSGDYLAANTLVDTTACSATNVIKWDGSQFACGAGGGGSGGGITNSAGANVVMLSDGTNAIPSPITYDGSTTVSVAAKDVAVGTSAAQHTLLINGMTQGWSVEGGLYDYRFDPNGLSFVDSVVGAVCTHGSGTDETFAVGWTPNCTAGLQGSLDVRTQNASGTVANKDSAAVHVEKTDTVNTGSSARNSYGLYVINTDNRGTGTGALTSYGLYVDNPGNAQTNWGLDVARSGVQIEAGGLSVLAGTSTVQALTVAGTMTGHAVNLSGNLINTSPIQGSKLTSTGNIEIGADLYWTGANSFLYPQAAVAGSTAQDTNIAAAGTGTIIFNANGIGTNAGTGGLKLVHGANSNTVEWSVNASGNEVVTGNSTVNGTFNNAGGLAELGDLFVQTAAGVIYMYANSGSNETINFDAAGTGSVDVNSNAGGITNGGTGGLRVFAGANSSTVVFATPGTGHVKTGGTAPSTLSSCGTGSPAVTSGSTDFAGQVTEGTTATGCTMNFANTYTTAPICVCSATTAITVGCTASATQLTIVNASATGDVVNYHCVGH